jgi:hypothetical protein
VERFAVAKPQPWRAPVAVRRPAAVRDLHELIAALDRRIPQGARTGEAAIATEAAALKTRALKRIAELEAAPAVVK